MGIKIVKHGTKVITSIGSIEAMITGVCIRETHIVYELSYFVQGEYKTIWVNRFEFEVAPPKKKAGFVNYEQDETDTNFLIEVPHEEAST